jgi:hypothetical protein
VLIYLSFFLSFFLSVCLLPGVHKTVNIVACPGPRTDRGAATISAERPDKRTLLHFRDHAHGKGSSHT